VKSFRGLEACSLVTATIVASKFASACYVEIIRHVDSIAMETPLSKIEQALWTYILEIVCSKLGQRNRSLGLSLAVQTKDGVGLLL
jgi:hypothetical protein